MNGHPHQATAETVELTFSPTDPWTTEALQEHSFRAYLHRVHEGDVTVGDTWEEFVNCGCGKTRDVVLRVHTVHGGSRIGPATTFEFHPQEG